MKNIEKLLVVFISLILINISLFGKFYPSVGEHVDDTLNAVKAVPLEVKGDAVAVMSDFNSTTDINKTQMNEIQNNFGLLKIDKNLSFIKQNVDKNTSQSDTNKSYKINISDFKGYSDSVKGKYAEKGLSLSQKIGKDLGEIDSSDVSSLTQDSVILFDANSTDARASQWNKDFYASVRSKMANLKTIQCYITRKLANSYYCPISGMENSFFKGGALKDSKKLSKKSCEDLCFAQSSCLHKSMNKPLSSVKNIEKNIDDSLVVDVNADESMLGKYIEFTIENKYEYDDNVSLTGSDYNNTKAEEALKKAANKVRIDVKYLDSNTSTYKELLQGSQIRLEDSTTVYRFYLSTFRSSSYKVTFHDIYILDNSGQPEIDNRIHSKLKKTEIKYAGNNWYFCPSINIVSNADECDGTVEQIQLGSEIYSICKETGRLNMEPTYGAFYTESSCNSACKVSKECVPTYKHLTGLNPLALPSDIRDVEIGCVDDVTNTSCTTELCKELFIKDDMPLTENTWTSDDEVKHTVVNKSATSETRPRIDVAGGLSSNGNATQRELTSLREMSEIAYQNMLKDGTFELSKFNIAQNIKERSWYTKDILNGKTHLEWNLKPMSFDIDDGKTYYFYAVFKVASVFTPYYGSYRTKDGLVSGTTDDNIRIQDKTTLLKTPTGFRIIRKTLNNSGKFPVSVNQETNETIYKWIGIDAYKQERVETFNGVDFSAYDKDSPAVYFDSKQFSSDNKYETFDIFNSMEQVVSTPGVLFNNQDSLGGGTSFRRVYEGDAVDDYNSHVRTLIMYGIYSSVKLTYQEILDKIKDPTTGMNKYLLYSSVDKLRDTMITDGRFDNDKVQLFIGGKPNIMSVNADFNPDSTEDGKNTFIYMLLYKDEN